MDCSELFPQLIPVSGNRYNLPRTGRPPIDLYLHLPTSPSGIAYINLHGGGWRGGDASLMETFADFLCRELDAVVINLNYQKRPMMPFPFAAEEACDCVTFLRDNAETLGISPERIVIGGCSAGGHLAASAAVLLSDRGIPLAGQCLVYPCTDMPDVIARLGYESLREDMFPEGNEGCREASPLLADTDSLTHVAPAAFVLSGRDSILSHGRGYAQKLTDAGVPVLVKLYRDALHGFVEVNRPDYPANDPRRSPEQEALCHDAEHFIVSAVRLFCRQ